MSKDEKQKIAFSIGARAGKDFHALVELINLPESDLWSRIVERAKKEDVKVKSVPDYDKIKEALLAEEKIRKQNAEARKKVLDELLENPLTRYPSSIDETGREVFNSGGKNAGKSFKASIKSILETAGKIAVGNYADKFAPGVIADAIKQQEKLKAFQVMREQEVAKIQKLKKGDSIFDGPSKLKDWFHPDEFEKVSIPEDIAKHYNMDWGREKFEPRVARWERLTKDNWITDIWGSADESIRGASFRDVYFDDCMSNRFVSEPTFLFELPYKMFQRLPLQFQKALHRYNLTFGLPDGFNRYRGASENRIAFITCTQYQLQKFVKEIEEFDQCLARDFMLNLRRSDRY